MTNVPPAQPEKWVLPAVAGLAAVWAAALGTLAATTADPPTLNRAQLARADALVRAVVVDPGGKGGTTLRVEDMLPLNGATAEGLAADGLAAGAEVTAARFPRGGAAAGSVAAVPVRRVGRGWEVAPAGVRDGEMVRGPVYRGDWAELSAAAAELAAGRGPYR